MSETSPRMVVIEVINGDPTIIFGPNTSVEVASFIATLGSGREVEIVPSNSIEAYLDGRFRLKEQPDSEEL